jgi:hypothetical protein
MFISEELEGHKCIDPLEYKFDDNSILWVKEDDITWYSLNLSSLPTRNNTILSATKIRQNQK